MNRRLYNNQSFVLTAIYRVFAIYNFSSKNLNRTVLPAISLNVQIKCLTAYVPFSATKLTNTTGC
ncbi:MAG: hypothetical protein V7K69_08915 [Nostoc sp.]|uniref:hypothetical protein n=1 Tax=Nostoc sp. TaxID=1180 RepID=UPI002FF852C1